jgi:antitoxin CptB
MGQGTPGQILWRCRRGIRELDLLLERYARGGHLTAPAAERARFEALLELPDPLLAWYLLSGEPPADPALAPLIARIRTYVA